VDAASHRILADFVREVTAEERDTLLRLALAVERIEVSSACASRRSGHGRILPSARRASGSDARRCGCSTRG
jgi:hypothetical protein